MMTRMGLFKSSAPPLDTTWPAMTSDSSGGFITSASSVNGAGFEAFKAHDGDNATRWASTGTTGSWRVQAPSNRKVSAYTILPFADATFAPSTWTFRGSPDGSTWTTLDTRTSETFVASTPRTFTVASPLPFLYHEFVITAVNGGSLIIINNIDFTMIP